MGRIGRAQSEGNASTILSELEVLDNIVSTRVGYVYTNNAEYQRVANLMAGDVEGEVNVADSYCRGGSLGVSSREVCSQLVMTQSSSRNQMRGDLETAEQSFGEAVRGPKARYQLAVETIREKCSQVSVQKRS